MTASASSADWAAAGAATMAMAAAVRPAANQRPRKIDAGIRTASSCGDVTTMRVRSPIVVDRSGGINVPSLATLR